MKNYKTAGNVITLVCFYKKQFLINYFSLLIPTFARQSQLLFPSCCSLSLTLSFLGCSVCRFKINFTGFIKPLKKFCSEPRFIWIPFTKFKFYCFSGNIHVSLLLRFFFFAKITRRNIFASKHTSTTFAVKILSFKLLQSSEVLLKCHRETILCNSISAQ